MKRIALEEHFVTEKQLAYLRSRKDYPRLEQAVDEKGNRVERLARTPSSSRLFSPEDVQKLLDVGSGRIAEMDRAGIAMQVLSNSGPSVEEYDASVRVGLARSINDELADAVRRNPKRFAAFATLPYGEPLAAADELERCVVKLGMKGTKISSHVGGEYLDDRRFWPLFERAEALGVPIYLHPKEPPQGLSKFFAPYPALAAPMWGFSVDASLHAMRLICSGLFDRYPKLKIILGHLGEGIPFWLWRIDNRWVKDRHTGLKKLPGEYFRENFRVTTSGMFSDAALGCVHQAIGADNILFAVDYPFESSEEAVSFMDAAPLGLADKEKICHANAEALLALPA